MSKDFKATADAILNETVTTGQGIPGVVAMVTDRTGNIYEGAVGKRRTDQSAPMTTDSSFAIFSTTKAITGTAALQLIEDGKLDLDAPAKKYAPDIGRLQVIEGFDAKGQPKLRAPKRDVTTRMLLLHTAFTVEVMAMSKKPTDRIHAMCCVLDGRDEKLLQWISDSGISALIADNYGVEAVPARPGKGDKHPALPLHHHCLFKLGLNLGEIWWLHDLAMWLRKAGRSRFLLTAPPLRLPGAVGSPATPVATV